MRRMMRAGLFVLAGAGAVFVFEEVAGATHRSAPPTTGMVLCVSPVGTVTAGASDGSCGTWATKHVVADQLSASQAFQRIDALEHSVEALTARLTKLETLLAGVSREGSTLSFSGMNVRVVNGTGTTASANGLGNLLVGYNELRGTRDQRTGSHNVVIGARNNYIKWGGLVVGEKNDILGEYSSVSGGKSNTASGVGSSVSGGSDNTALALVSSVSGGTGNVTWGDYSSVSGGRLNSAKGLMSSVSGGDANTASGGLSSVSGGYRNSASGPWASVSGGLDNTASGAASSVTGGDFNTASGSASSVSGGHLNKPSGTASSVSGGINRSVSGPLDWRAGHLFSDG